MKLQNLSKQMPVATTSSFVSDHYVFLCNHEELLELHVQTMELMETILPLYNMLKYLLEAPVTEAAKFIDEFKAMKKKTGNKEDYIFERFKINAHDALLFVSAHMDDLSDVFASKITEEKQLGQDCIITSEQILDFYPSFMAIKQCEAVIINILVSYDDNNKTIRRNGSLKEEMKNQFKIYFELLKTLNTVYGVTRVKAQELLFDFVKQIYKTKINIC
jgi:hypothetical protein